MPRDKIIKSSREYAEYRASDDLKLQTGKVVHSKKQERVTKEQELTEAQKAYEAAADTLAKEFPKTLEPHKTVDKEFAKAQEAYKAAEDALAKAREAYKTVNNELDQAIEADEAAEKATYKAEAAYYAKKFSHTPAPGTSKTAKAIDKESARESGDEKHPASFEDALKLMEVAQSQNFSKQEKEEQCRFASLVHAAKQKGVTIRDDEEKGVYTLQMTNKFGPEAFALAQAIFESAKRKSPCTHEEDAPRSAKHPRPWRGPPPKSRPYKMHPYAGAP